MSQIIEAEAQLTQEREALHEIELKIKFLIDKKISSRPETTLSYRSAQLASMWLGKAKGALGLKTPYGASFDASSKAIEDRADMGATSVSVTEADEIVAVKALRFELNKLEGDIQNDMSILLDKKKYQLCIANAWHHCCNATMWLGMVLNQIKIESEQPKKEKAPKADKPANTGKKDKGVPPAMTVSSGSIITHPESPFTTGTTTESAETNPEVKSGESKPEKPLVDKPKTTRKSKKAEEGK